MNRYKFIDNFVKLKIEFGKLYIGDKVIVNSDGVKGFDKYNHNERIASMFGVVVSIDYSQINPINVLHDHESVPRHWMAHMLDRI